MWLDFEIAHAPEQTAAQPAASSLSVRTRRVHEVLRHCNVRAATASCRKSTSIITSWKILKETCNVAAQDAAARCAVG